MRASVASGVYLILLRTAIIIINKSKESVTLEQELVPDMIELITVFSAGLYGRAPSEKSETD